MKRTMLILFFILVGALAFAQNSGVIRELSGTVEIKTAGAVDFTPAAIGAQVWEDTVISTGFRSTALIAIESTLLTVRPLSRLTLTEIRSQSGLETLNVNLQAGRVRVDVHPPAGTRASMTVTSPSATASVRGTSFEFDGRNLYVEDGIVAFKGHIGQEISIRPGSGITTGSGITIGDRGNAQNPVAAGSSSLRPQSPGGGDTSPGSISSRGESSDEPGRPNNPNNTDPGDPGGSSNPNVPGITVEWN